MCLGLVHWPEINIITRSTQKQLLDGANTRSNKKHKNGITFYNVYLRLRKRKCMKILSNELEINTHVHHSWLLFGKREEKIDIEEACFFFHIALCSTRCKNHVCLAYYRQVKTELLRK